MIFVPGRSLLPARAPTFVGRAVSLTGVNAYLTGVYAYLTGVNAYLLAQVPAGTGASTSLVSPVTLVPQDKERFGSETSHEENVVFIFEDLAPFTTINFSRKLFTQKRGCLKVDFQDSPFLFSPLLPGSFCPFFPERLTNFYDHNKIIDRIICLFFVSLSELSFTL
ncbi:hypothetical protein QUF84_25890 [Fictibacillus enclensis]|uniref:hypothetical protein n=1 Tax=Fictibacillus enclensis TaxID=1017270 RepID=UPI0025A05B7B|nr:hypothetical protein [Fictibacillus enclensis]MDM5340625.1 hypothetical protein [Fictibacillus enclensis]